MSWMQQRQVERYSMYHLSMTRPKANDAVPRGSLVTRTGAGIRVTCLTLIVLGLVMVVMAGCSRVDQDIEGVWYRSVEDLDVFLSFEKETFWLRVGSGSRQMVGRYEIEGDTLKLVDEDCGEAVGSYLLKKAEGRITFTLIEDACEGRTSVLQGEWVQKE